MSQISPKSQPDLATAIRIVMKEARMTYHIASCVRHYYPRFNRTLTHVFRAELMRMEKRGEVCRIPYCPRSQPYRKQIAWKLNETQT